MNKVITGYPYAILIIGLVIVAEVIAIVFFLKIRKQKFREQPVSNKKEVLPPQLPFQSEIVAPLEREDVNELTRSIRSAFIILIMITVISWAVLYFFVDAGLFGYSIFIFIISLLWAGMVSGRKDFLRMIREDKKIILKGIIAERYETVKESGDSTWEYYFLRIGEHTLRVDKSMYKRYTAGQAIEFHFVRNSDALPIFLKDKLLS